MSESQQPDPHKMKVVELKAELSKLDLETSGLKKDLVDRLVAAQNLGNSGGSETGPLSEEVKAMGVPLGHRAREAAALAEDAEEDAVQPEDTAGGSGDVGEAQEAVGHAMVEDAEEQAAELDAQAEAAVSDSDIELEPAVLDSEVARTVAKEEAKAALPPTPPRIRSISPLPPSRPATPPRDQSQDGDQAGESSTRARKRSPSPSVPTSPRHKRQRRTDYLPLPSSLSHLVHPPTCTLYITNLRRPLVHSALHEHVFPASTPAGPSSRFTAPRQPFAGEAFPALWLSGVKDHAYATYLSEQDALEAAERIHSTTWPEEDGAELQVQFVDDHLVRGLLEQEEDAWTQGRQKLTLKVTKDEEEETGYKFGLTGGNPNARGRLPPPRPPPGAAAPAPTRRPPVAVPLTGVNAVRPAAAPANGSITTAAGPNGSDGDRRDPPPHAPTGPSAPARNASEPARANFVIRGRGGGYMVPPHMAHNGWGNANRDRETGLRGAVVPPGASLGGTVSGKEDGRLARPVKRTHARPFITFREGPGAVAGR